MASREEVLMSMRAPAPQDLDMKQVLRALAGVAAQDRPGTSWGYGMRLTDAQKEGALAGEYQREQTRQVQQAQDAATAQDSQLFNRAAQAHNMALQERQLAQSAAQHAASLQLQREQFAHSRDLANRQMAMQETNAENERELRRARIKKFNADAERATAGAEKARQATAAQQELREKFGGLKPSDKMMQRAQKQQQNKDLGFSPAGAAILADLDQEKFGKLFSKSMEKRRAAAVDTLHRPFYGTKMVDGKLVAITKEEWEQENELGAIQESIPNLSRKDAELLQSIRMGTYKSPAELQFEQQAPTQTSPSDNELFELLLQGAANAYSQKR